MNENVEDEFFGKKMFESIPGEKRTHTFVGNNGWGLIIPNYPDAFVESDTARASMQAAIQDVIPLTMALYVLAGLTSSPETRKTIIDSLSKHITIAARKSVLAAVEDVERATGPLPEAVQHIIKELRDTQETRPNDPW
jgi:hypothetical protein